jgi:UDP-N-acetylmuramoyl-L-alanyl-D-glutamate--2,6-diaminopimelate ligase
MHKYLAQMVQLQNDVAVLETTSNNLHVEGFFGLTFDAAVFTNLTLDHLDFHKTWGCYQQSKEKLFASVTGTAVVNADDPAAGAFLKYDAAQKLTFGILDEQRPADALPNPDLTARALRQIGDRTTFWLSTPGGAAEVCVPLFGRHTVANVLAAVGLGLSQGVSFSSICETLGELRAPEGRLQRVDMGQPFSVFVDFAHNEDGLRQVYRAVRPMVSGRLIAVLGGGGLFPAKRPVLGALAAQYADRVIVTTEDPRRHDPVAAIDEVAAGVARGRGSQEPGAGEGVWWWRIVDRGEALVRALAMAQPGDTVLVTGRGGEKEMPVGDEWIPFDDVAVIQELLSRAEPEASGAP